MHVEQVTARHVTAVGAAAREDFRLSAGELLDDDVRVVEVGSDGSSGKITALLRGSTCGHRSVISTARLDQGRWCAAGLRHVHRSPHRARPRA